MGVVAMSERVYTLVACDDCGRGYPFGELVAWREPALLLCVACAAKRREAMGDE